MREGERDALGEDESEVLAGRARKRSVIVIVVGGGGKARRGSISTIKRATGATVKASGNELVSISLPQVLSPSLSPCSWLLHASGPELGAHEH